MNEEEKYLEEVGVEIKQRNMSKEKIKLYVHGWDWEKGRWREQLNRRESLQVYRNKEKRYISQSLTQCCCLDAKLTH